MSNGFLKVWAFLATAVALVLLGIVIGRHTEKSAPVDYHFASGAPGVSAATDSRDPTTAPVAPYSVPGNFVGLKTQWRSALNNEALNGYAILFDPERREVILEYCLHPGYFNAKLEQPIYSESDFCQTVLWGTLVELSETVAKAVDRQGNAQKLTLRLNKNGPDSRLEISFDEHELDLVYGSKNDLFQLVEQSEAIREQKQQRFAFEQEDIKKRLARRANEIQQAPDVPRYTLPEPKGEAREK